MVDARTVVGVIGNIISLLLFLSPSPSIWKIHKDKSVQQFKPDPYLATFLNCAMCVLYGTPIVHPDSLLVLTINGVGLVIEFIYLAVFIYYGTKAVRKKIAIVGLLELGFIGAVLGVTLGVWHSTKGRSLFVGIVCIVLNVIMYIAFNDCKSRRYLSQNGR